MANMTLEGYRVLPNQHFLAKRHAQHSRRRSAAGYALRPAQRSPFVYTLVVAPTYFSGGEHIGAAAINRNAFLFYAQDTWKISPRLVLDYGLRYELYTPVTERAKRTSGIAFSTTPFGVAQQFVINPQPGYRFNINGLGRACSWIGWRATRSTSAPAVRSRPSRRICTRTTHSRDRLRLRSIPALPRLRRDQSRTGSRSRRASCRACTRLRGRTFSQRHQGGSRQYSDGFQPLPAGSGCAFAEPSITR